MLVCRSYIPPTKSPWCTVVYALCRDYGNAVVLFRCPDTLALRKNLPPSGVELKNLHPTIEWGLYIVVYWGVGDRSKTTMQNTGVECLQHPRDDFLYAKRVQLNKEKVVFAQVKAFDLWQIIPLLKYRMYSIRKQWTLNHITIHFIRWLSAVLCTNEQSRWTIGRH